jgi:hypothetical protein
MNLDPRVEQPGVDLEGPERANAAARARTLAALRTEGQRLRTRRTRRRVTGGVLALAAVLSVGITLAMLRDDPARGGLRKDQTTAAGLPRPGEPAGVGSGIRPAAEPSRYAAVWHTVTNAQGAGSFADPAPSRVTVVPMTTEELIKQLEDDGHPIGVIEAGGRVRLVRSRAIQAE